LNAGVAGSDIPLTSDQQQLLVAFTWQEYSSGGVDFFLSPVYSRITDGRQYADQMYKKTQANAKIRDFAAEFLTESQLAKLRSFQTAQIRQMQMSPHLRSLGKK